jgi:hypothetical protein
MSRNRIISAGENNLKDYIGVNIDSKSANGLIRQIVDTYYMKGVVKIGLKKHKEAFVYFQIANKL